MGNLYTHLVPYADERITILSRLKQLWHRYRSEIKPQIKRTVMAEIKEQQKKLSDLDTPTSIDQPHSALKPCIKIH